MHRGCCDSAWAVEFHVNGWTIFTVDGEHLTVPTVISHVKIGEPLTIKTARRRGYIIHNGWETCYEK